MIPATSDGQSMQVANSATSTMKSSPLRRGRSVRSAAFLPPQVVVRRWTKPRLLLLWWRTSWRKWKPIPDTLKNCFERRPLDHRFRLLVIHPCFVCFVTHKCAPGTTLVRQVKGLRRTTTQSRIRSWNRNRNNHKQETKSSRRHEQANNQSPRKHTHILPHHKPSPLHFLTKIPGRLVQRENLFSKHVFTNHRDPFPSSLGLPCPRVVSSSSLVIFVIYFLHFSGLVFFVLPQPTSEKCSTCMDFYFLTNSPSSFGNVRDGICVEPPLSVEHRSVYMG